MLSASRERRILTAYRSWRTQPPTWGTMLRRYAGIWLVLVGLALLVFGILHHTPIETAGWLVDGMVLGAILRDLGAIRQQLAVWPTLAEIVDWARVDARLADRAVTTPS